MKYIDEKISKLNPQSVDRNRLYIKTKIQIVADIKRISVMEHGNFYKEIDSIYNIQLLEEISRHINLLSQ